MPTSRARSLLATFYTLRQQMQKPEGEPEYALADFIAPKETGLADYLGAFAVTAGIGAPELAARFEKAHDDYNAIMAKALADRLAEALAEWMHKQARDAWGFGKRRKSDASTICCANAIAASVPRPAIRPRPTTPRKTTLFDCWTPKKRDGHRS